MSEEVLALHGFTQNEVRKMFDSGKISVAGNSLTTYAIINDQKVFFRYAHAPSVLKYTDGQMIPGRGVIGPVGTTGRSTGNHAHFEVWVNERPETSNPFLYRQQGDRFYLHPTYFNRKILGGNGR